MNRLHQWLCSSGLWARAVEQRYLPWALEGTGLGANVLELGPGYGATTRVIARRCERLTALELNQELASRMARVCSSATRVVHGDATAMPFEPAAFDSVVCFTMLHHVPTPALQDRLFAEAFRVLRPNGLFAGADSLVSFGFRMLHIADTMVLVDPNALPERLASAGFVDIEIAQSPRRAFKFRARKPLA